MAVKDINDLYQQLSADENFNGLFNSPEEFASTMQNMSSERQQAFYDKLVSGTQISNVDFTNALKKKEEGSSTFESLSVGSKPNEPIQKVNIPMPEMPSEAAPIQQLEPSGEVLPIENGEPTSPIDPKQRLKNKIIGITNEMNTNPTGNWSQQYQELLKDPDYQKYKMSGDIQKEFNVITGEWERLSKKDPSLKQIGEQIGLVPKQEVLPIAPAPKSVVLKKPETLFGRLYADSVAAEKRKKDQLGQSTRPMFVESDNAKVELPDPNKLLEGDENTKKSIERFKQNPSTLYNAISNKKLKYFTPQGQEVAFDDYALGSLLFNHTSIELQDANGPVDLSNLNAVQNRKSGLSFLNEDLFRKNLIQNGFPEYKVDEEVNRLKMVYRQQQAAHEMDQIKTQFLNESGGNQAIANVKFLNRYNEEGRQLLTDDEQEAYAIVNQLETLHKKIAKAKTKGTLVSSGIVDGVDIEATRKQIISLQAKLSAIRDNPNNLYDWKTGEFIDTRIASNKPKVQQIKKENEEFQIKYADTPKGDLTRLRNTLLAQREFIARKMSEDGIPVPEAGTFGSFMAKLQTSAARTSGTYSITLPNGLSMNSAQYEKKVEEYQNQLLDVERNLYGINRALMLNENVLLRKESEGFLASIVPSVVTAAKSIGREFIPGAGEGDAKADWEIRNSLLMLSENGYSISPELKSLARKSVGEQIFDSAGTLADAMFQIALGNIAIPEIASMKWAKKMSSALNNKYGRGGEAVFLNTADVIRQGSVFQLAGQGFSTGVGEALGQITYDAMKLDRLFVNKGRLLPFLTRSILGGTGEVISEYAGQYLQVLADNGINAKDNFKKTFGHDVESGVDQLLVIGITSTLFSGAANIKLLTATSSTLQNILDNPQSAAAYGEVIDEDKRKEIEEVLKVVNDKLHDRQAQKENSNIAKDKSESYQEPLDAPTRTQEVSDLQEKRKAELEKIYDTNTITDENDRKKVDALVDEVNQKYDDQINSLMPKTTEFESLTGNNLSAVVAGSDLNAPHVVEFLANIPTERNRRAAAEMIAIAQKANNTLRSVLPQATIVLHDKKSFADKMAQRGISDSRKGNFSIHKSNTGGADIEIQINVEDGTFEDVAHEVTHGILFNKFYNNDARIEEINKIKDTITESPKELNQKIEEINQKYDKEFSDTLGKFKDGLSKVASESQSKYLDEFVKNYDENSSAEEYIVEFAALLANNGERLQQEDPSFFKRLLALFNKLVSSIGNESKIKLQEFKDVQEIVDFMNSVSSALRGGTALEITPTKQKTTKTTETTEKVKLEDKARNTSEEENKINEIYDAFPELAKIGTPQEYSEYLNSVFPASQVKDIVYNMNEGDIIPSREGSFGYGYYFLSKKIADLFTSKETNAKNAVILNMQSPLNLADDKQYNAFEEKYGQVRAVSHLINNDNDSVVRNKYKTSNVESKEYYVMEPEQIHQLGSKQDIKDFEKFIDSKKTKEERKLLNQEKELDNLFNEVLELKNIGTKKEYAQYLKSIFPESKVKDILYHGTKRKFENFEKEKLGINTGSPSAALGFFFATEKDTSLSYIGNQFTEYQKEYQDYRTEYEKVIDAKQKNKKELLLALDNYRKKLDTLLQKILVFLKLSATKQKYKKTKNEIDKLNEEIDKLADLHLDRITEDIDVYLQKTNQVVDDIIKTYMKPRKDTRLLRVIVDIKNPGLHNDNNQGYREESYFNRINKDLGEGRDGTIIENTEDWGGYPIYNEEGLKNVPVMDTDVVVAYEPEQIHILGSEKDLENFKEFIEEKNAELQKQPKLEVQEQFEKDLLTPREPLGLKPEEEEAVYNIIDDEKGNLVEQKNLDIQGSFSIPFKPSGRLVDKARIDYTEDFDLDGIPMRPVKYISPLTSRNKKYNATMSDHTKVGSYINPRTGTVVKNLFGGFLYSYIAENYDNGVVWASTGIKQARELILNSAKQDKTLIYRMNRSTGSKGNDNFATIAVEELLNPLKKGLVTEEEMLDILNERMKTLKVGQIILSQKYTSGSDLGKVKIKQKDVNGNSKEVELNMKAFSSIKEFRDAVLGGGKQEKLSFAIRGKLWDGLLVQEVKTKTNNEYYKQLNEWGVPTINDINDLIAEPVTDAANDSDIVGALKINAPEMVDVVINNKMKSVPKIWTTFENLVDEENGVYFTKGVKHSSYPYVVKGEPLGVYSEFHSALDYFPIVKDWMSRTTEAEGFLTKEEFLAKNADAIRQAEADHKRAQIAYEEIRKNKEIPKEVKELLKKEMEKYEKLYKQASSFSTRLSSPYKAIETMHKELMQNFDSTAQLVPTERRPLVSGVVPMQDKARIEPWSTPQQEITSAGTSINKAKLPSVYSDKAFFNILKNVKGDKITIVDVGSGKYANVNIKPLLERGEISDLITEGSRIKLSENAVPTIQEVIASKQITYLPYDPFNQPADVNENTISQVRGGGANIAISPNVLNVIAEAEAREGVIANLADAVGDTGTAIIQIYEGEPKDRGNGKVTKTGGENSWQNNQPTSWYIPEVKKYFANVKFANKIIIADNKVFEDKARVSEKESEAKSYGVPQRYKGDVGKFIGGDLYVHKSAMDVFPQKEFETAESKLPEDFQYEIVKYNAAQGSFSFIASPDWNSANEPIVGDSYKVSRTGEVTLTKQKSDPQIYHHKWNFVRDNYDGFNVRQSIQRSIDWYRDAKEELNIYKIGTKSYWEQNAEPLIKNTILNLEDKARRQDDIQNDVTKLKQQYPSISYDTLGQKLVAKGYTLGEIKRFIPELAKFYQKEAVNKFTKAIKTTQGKIAKRQKDIRQEMVKNANLSYTTLYDVLKDRYEDFEIYKSFYEEGANPSELDELFGTDYRQTIQNFIEQTQDGKTVFNPDLMREIRGDARARKMVGIADQMMNVFGELGDIISAEEIINMAADSLEEGFIEGAMKQVTDDMRRRRKEVADGVDQLKKISKGEIKSDTVLDVSKLLSIAGRILQTGRGLTETQEGLEKLIFNSLEVVEYRPGRDVIRKHRVFKLTPAQRQKISAAIKSYRESSQAFKEATKTLEEGPDMYTDEAFLNFDKAKAQLEKDSRNLKVTISAFKRVGFGNWFSSTTALGLLSIRTLVIGIVGNVEMQLASMPKKSKIGKIFGWGRIIADKLVKNFSQVGSKSGINEFIARGTGTSVDTSIYRKMAFEQGKQQIINIFQNTVSDVSTNKSSFMENQAVIDSNQELKKSFKMFGKLFVSLLPTTKKLTDEDWANAFDKLLLLMNEKDENGEYKLANQNPKGYQAASTFLRGVFGSIPQGTGKAISLSGDRIFFKYGYYHSLTAYANFMGITDPREIQRFIRLNSVPGTNADAMARRAGDYRIFQSDNKLVDAFSSYRRNIAQKEKNLAAKSLVFKTQGKGAERFARVYPAKLNQLGYKLGAVITSPFTRIPSNFISIGVQKTVFPISFADYIIKQMKLREKVKEYDDLFDLDKNATMTKTKVREMEAMRLEIFELQTKTQKALSNSLQAVQVLAFGGLLLASGAASAPYGDDEDEKARARAAGIAQQPSGSINFTHFFEWMTGQANRYRVTKKGDIIMNYTNLGIIGFGLSEIMSLGAKMKGKELEQKNIMGSEEESSFGWDLVFESLSNGVTNLSFIQNVVALGNAIKGQGTAVENLGINLTKTLLTVPTLSFGVFGAVERAEGITIDPMRNYVPELEVEDGAMNRFKARIITSLTGKSPLTWFGLKDEKGEFISPYASPFYRAQIGPHGEELYKKNTFWDVRSGDWLGAYVQASFDPFSFHDYEGFVSMVKPYAKGSDYKKGDIIQGESGIYAVLKDLKNFDLKNSNTNQNDLDVQFIESKEKYFDRDRFISNQRGTQYSQNLFDLLNIYQQATGDNKPFKVMSRLYDPYIKAKDAEGEINIYIPEKYFRELAMARGKVARDSYSLEDLQSTLDRLYRVEDEKIFETDEEYKEFVKKEIQTLFLGPMDTQYNRTGGIETMINKAVDALEKSEDYKRITRLALIEGLKSEKYTEEEYNRMVNAEGISPFILGIPKEELKFKK